MKFTIIFLSLITSVFSFSQESGDNFNLNVDVAYNFHDLTRWKGPGGIRLGVSGEHKRFEYSLYGTFNFYTVFNYDTDHYQRVMKDKFARLGLSLQGNLFKFGRSAIWMGVHGEKFFFLNHYYYYTSKITFTEYEVSCRDCPLQNWPAAHSYSFGRQYLWQFGLNIRYDYSITPDLSVFLNLQNSLLIVDDYLSIPPSYLRVYTYGLSPNLGLKYSFF